MFVFYNIFNCCFSFLNSMFQIIIKSNVVFTVIFTNDSIAYHEKWVYFQSPVLLYHPFFYYFNFWFAVRILHVHLELTTNCNKNNHNFNLTCCLRVSLAWAVLKSCTLILSCVTFSRLPARQNQYRNFHPVSFEPLLLHESTKKQLDPHVRD